MILRLLALYVTAAVLQTGIVAGGDNWPQFRGPGGRSVSSNPRLPLQWSASENIAWKTAIPGSGWSSPVVWGDKVFLTSVVSEGEEEQVKGGLYVGGERPAPREVHHWMVFCLALETGKILWQKEVAKEVPLFSRHLKNTYASETPVVDARRVYFYFGQKGIFVFDHQGKEIWRRDQGPFGIHLGWGTASSPVLHEEKLIIVNDNLDGSYIAAYDGGSGREIWRVPREEQSNWATPFIWKNRLRTEIVTNGLNKVRSYDTEGKVLWEIQGPFGRLIIPSPFAANDLLYVTSGYVGSEYRPAFAVKPGAAGTISLSREQKQNDFIAWHDPTAGPYNPSPIVVGNYYYTLFDRGFFTCHDAKTGREIYGKQRIHPESGAFTASPWAYRDRIFLLSEEGDTFVIQQGPEFKVLSKNSLNEFCMASPALVDDRLLIRTRSNLYCIRGGRSDRR